MTSLTTSPAKGPGRNATQNATENPTSTPEKVRRGATSETRIEMRSPAENPMTPTVALLSCLNFLKNSSQDLYDSTHQYENESADVL